jgi:Ni,Fe-hydrogenase III small subunit
MFDFLSILYHQGKQFIPDVAKVDLSESFRGRPLILGDEADEELSNLCPTGAITASPLQIDLGKCLLCGECAHARPDLVQFTGDYFLSTNDRNALQITKSTTAISVDPEIVRSEIKKLYNRSLRLRQVSAGGDNSAEWELNACSNVNFDMGRFGIEFVASPRHADGMVVTGPISKNMAQALKTTWEAIPDPKILILAGTDAISGGIFANSPAIDRNFLNALPVDLYVPGNPPHPLTFINGVLDLLGISRKNRA